MTGWENRRARREAERKAKKLAAKQEKLAPTSVSPESPAPQIPPTAAAYFAEQRAKADRELEAEFGAEFVAHARELGRTLCTRPQPHRNQPPERPTLHRSPHRSRQN